MYFCTYSLFLDDTLTKDKFQLILINPIVTFQHLKHVNRSMGLPLYTEYNKVVGTI